MAIIGLSIINHLILLDCKSYHDIYHIKLFIWHYLLLHVILFHVILFNVALFFWDILMLIYLIYTCFLLHSTLVTQLNKSGFLPY